MKQPIAKTAALPWFANLIFAARAYNRGLEENARIDRQRLEAAAFNARMQELERIRMAPVIEPLRHTHVPIILGAGNPSTLQGGSIPLGMDEGMIRMASALEKTAALMARSDVELLKEARGLGEAFSGAVAATKKGLGGLLSSAKNIPGNLITGVRSKVPGPRISSPTAGLGAALKSPSGVAKTLHDAPLLSPSWVGQGPSARSFVAGATPAKAVQATAPMRAVAPTQEMPATARVGSPAATAVISPPAAPPAALPPPPALAAQTLVSPGLERPALAPTLHSPELAAPISPQRAAPPPSPAVPAATLPIGPGPAAPAVTPPSPDRATTAPIPQGRGFNRTRSSHQTRQEVPMVATSPHPEALRPTAPTPIEVERAQAEFGNMRNEARATQLPPPPVHAETQVPTAPTVAPPSPPDRPTGMPWTTKAMLGLGAGALGTAYLGGKALDTAGRILAPHELPPEQWGTSWGMPPTAVNQYGQPMY